MLSLRAGMVDQTGLVKPGVNVYMQSRIASTPIDPALKAFDKDARLGTRLSLFGGDAALGFGAILEDFVGQVDGREFIFFAPMVLGMPPVPGLTTLRQKVLGAEQISGIKVLFVDP